MNERDYRAWYGLGQTYELLKMPLYALHYFGKAAVLRPYDARMWCAIGELYHAIRKLPEASKAFQKALAFNDRESIALFKLARLYLEMQDEDTAAAYYKRNLDAKDAQEIEGEDTKESLLFLAHYCTRKGSLDEAEAFCERLLDFSGKEKEEAKTLLQELHSLKLQRQEKMNTSVDMDADDN